MRLHVAHETVYDYVPAVEVAQHMAYLRPREGPWQALLAHALHVEPEPEQQSQAQDVFGNIRTFLSLQTPHSQLRLVASSLVDTFGAPAGDSRVAWEAVRERLRFRADGHYDPASEFAHPSTHVPRLPEFASYAAPSFETGRPLIDVAQDLMHRIHGDMRYESQSTQVSTPAVEALAARHGVCQDFAHIMIAGLRAMGVAARYVSGYLLTQPLPGQPRMIGGDASHAWVSVYLPDLPEGRRWCDFDPTNDRWGWGTPGEDYVVLAVGRDFADVSPVRGVIHGGASHLLTVSVDVEPQSGAAT
jgi:transglutaminase-like putative cysteine protease